MENLDSLAINADHIPGLVTVYNLLTGTYLFVGKRVSELLGYGPEEFLRGGTAFSASLVHPDDLVKISEQNRLAVERANENPEAAARGEAAVRFEYRMRHKNGDWKWIQTDGSVFRRSMDGRVELVINISMDVTERKEAELRLEQAHSEIQNRKRKEKRLIESEEHFRTLIEAVEDYAIFALDHRANIISWNEGVEYILGYTQSEIVSKNFRDIFSEDAQNQGIPEQELKKVQSRRDSVYEGLLKRKDGSTFHGIVTLTAITDETKNLKGFSVILRDVTEKKEAEETIRYQAFHDTLTGLANREALYERFTLGQSLAVQHRHKLAILFLDLDRFKVINDTLGHAVGDIILREVADRLTHSVRASDTVTRLGGDEFILLLNEVNRLQDVIEIVQKIFQSLETVIRVQNRSLHVSSSIGIAVYPEDGEDLHTLLKNADIALYRAKDAGRNRYQFYNYSMNLQSVERLSLEEDLRNALVNRQFEIAYQPLVHIKAGKVLGAEALVRWKHPRLGILYPSDFIDIAEETGMIIPIGNWILKSVCTQGKRWEEQGLRLTISVNLSARQFAEENIVENIVQTLEETAFDPGLLELEITESIAMENIVRTSKKLQDLKQKGICIAIDDFGTGYSSLSYLKRFPVRTLKIDQSFIKHAITDPQDFAIVRAIISMGHSLGLKICAEGVESKQVMELLASMDCEVAQGYYISKPLFPHEFSSWLEKTNSALPLVLPKQA